MDITYWKHTSLEHVNKNYKCNGKYIIFTPWFGGFNNIRLSFELACTIAFRLNRILVIPNPYKITHLDNINGFDTFFDIEDIGIKTISMHEFCSINNIKNNNVDEIKKISTTYNFKPDESYINLTNGCHPSKIYTKNRTVINIDNTPENIYFDRNLLGTFYTLLYDNNMLELVKYVKRHIHYKKKIFTQTSVIIDYLNKTYTNYYALHIRRTDFQYAYKQVCIDMNTIYNNMSHLIPTGSCIYISTDIKNKDEFKLLIDNYKIIVFKDIIHLLDPTINKDLYGMIEQIICSKGVKFIGTHLSTFSCYIYRLRGYMDDNNDKNYYINTIDYSYKNSNQVISSGWQHEWTGNDNIWIREFIDGFDLDLRHYNYNNHYLTYVKFINMRSIKNKKIISFSLYDSASTFSNNRGFYKGIYVNYHLAKTLYPDWIIRIYMPYNEPAHIINELSKFTDIELVLINTNICCRALRFLPRDDENVMVWLSRDLDSIVNDREKVAVNDWLMNFPNKELHIMADHHYHKWTIASGMFGIKNNINKGITSLIDFMLRFSNDNYNIHQSYDFDSKIVEKFFYKEDNYIQHYGSGQKLVHSKSFPNHKPIDYDFVGSIADINSYYRKLRIIQLYNNVKNNDLFYYPPWNTNCIVNWYSADDFTLIPIQTKTSTSCEYSCLKTENGDGFKLLTDSSITISVLWNGSDKRNLYISDENTLAIIHGNEKYYFTRVQLFHKLKNNDLFYYSPWNTNCIVNWYGSQDFTLIPIQTNTSTSCEYSCLKTENGDGLKLLTDSGTTISVLWDCTEKRNVYISDKNTLAIVHGNEKYYFTRV